MCQKRFFFLLLITLCLFSSGFLLWFLTTFLIQKVAEGVEKFWKIAVWEESDMMLWSVARTGGRKYIKSYTSICQSINSYNRKDV